MTSSNGNCVPLLTIMLLVVSAMLEFHGRRLVSEMRLRFTDHANERTGLLRVRPFDQTVLEAAGDVIACFRLTVGEPNPLS